VWNLIAYIEGGTYADLFENSVLGIIFGVKGRGNRGLEKIT
jgi:hypothetical protein